MTESMCQSTQQHDRPPESRASFPDGVAHLSWPVSMAVAVTDHFPWLTARAVMLSC